MTPRFRQFVHSMVLGILFLLIAGANPAPLNIDGDGDDATPAVTVELNFALPCKKVATPQKAQRATVDAMVHESGKPAADFKHYGQHAPDEASLPLVVPLRT